MKSYDVLGIFWWIIYVIKHHLSRLIYPIFYFSNKITSPLKNQKLLVFNECYQLQGLALFNKNSLHRVTHRLFFPQNGQKAFMKDEPVRGLFLPMRDSIHTNFLDAFYPTMLTLNTLILRTASSTMSFFIRLLQQVGSSSSTCTEPRNLSRNMVPGPSPVSTPSPGPGGSASWVQLGWCASTWQHTDTQTRTQCWAPAFQHPAIFWVTSLTLSNARDKSSSTRDHKEQLRHTTI